MATLQRQQKLDEVRLGDQALTRGPGGELHQTADGGRRRC